MNQKSILRFYQLIGVLGLLCFTTASLSQPSQSVRFPSGATVWNVKNYGAKGDGKADDTEAFRRTITAALDHQARYTAIRVIYVPNGTYKVSNTLEAKDRNHMHWSQGWRAGFFLQGESEQQTVIKLTNRAAGFTDPQKPKAVIITGSENPNGNDGGGNQAFRHYIRNLTVDVGQGNPGAVGIDFITNNRGGVYQVTVRSADPQKVGHTGIRMDRSWPGPGILKYVTVNGFRFGISMWSHYQYSMTMEHIQLSNQTTYGIRVKHNTATIRSLSSQNSVPAIYMETEHSHLTLIDAKLTGGQPDKPAIISKAMFYGRNIRTAGYGKAIDDRGNDNRDRDGGVVTEYWNRGIYKGHHDVLASAIKLPIKETPEFHTNNFSNWAKVDGSAADDLSAIQGAIDSGKPVVYLPVGSYKVSNTIVLRGNVRKLVGLCASISKTNNFPQGKPILRYEGGTADNTIIQFIRFFGDIQHNSAKGLALVNMDISKGRYYNTTNGRGELFIEDIIADRVHSLFPQKIWARQLNCEFASETFVINTGGKAWLFGYKTEGKNGTVLHNRQGGWAELWGGFFYPNDGTPTLPMIINEEGYMTANYKMNGGRHNYGIHVRDIKGGNRIDFKKSQVPNSNNMPLYSSATRHAPAHHVVAIQNKLTGEYIRYRENRYETYPLTADQLKDWNTHKFRITVLNEGVKALKNENTGRYLWYKGGKLGAEHISGDNLESWGSHKLIFERQSDGYYWIRHRATGKYLYDKNGGLLFDNKPTSVEWKGPKWRIQSLTGEDIAIYRQQTPMIAEDVDLDQPITVYPNPVVGKLSIQWNISLKSIDGQPIKMMLYNASGVAVNTYLVSERRKPFEIPMDKLSNGLYLLVIQLPDKSYRYKVVKE